MAQCDWIEKATVWLNGELREIYLFVMVLNYSGAYYVEAFERTVQEAFFQGHANAFAFFGGVPAEVTYDNLKTAVIKILKGKNRVENERFVAFRSGYLFKARFCTPAKGNEKGRVENMNKFVERNFLTPLPRVASLAELNVELKARCQRYLSRCQARQSQAVAQRLLEEQSQFLSLPAFPPECCRLVAAKADKSALVQFETNRYSVPTEYAYQTLWLKAFVDRIVITDTEKPIAEHVRLPGKYQESIRFEHYRQALERKPGAFKHLRAPDKPLHWEAERARKYPKVTVQAPDLSRYQQLLRHNPHDHRPANPAARHAAQAPEAAHVYAALP
jgi:hypothetical protein